jgi:hypothetical protein
MYAAPGNGYRKGRQIVLKKNGRGGIPESPHPQFENPIISTINRACLFHDAMAAPVRYKEICFLHAGNRVQEHGGGVCRIPPPLQGGGV